MNFKVGNQNFRLDSCCSFQTDFILHYPYTYQLLMRKDKIIFDIKDIRHLLKPEVQVAPLLELWQGISTVLIFYDKVYLGVFKAVSDPIHNEFSDINDFFVRLLETIESIPHV
jgi:hypothetical protein